MYSFLPFGLKQSLLGGIATFFFACDKIVGHFFLRVLLLVRMISRKIFLLLWKNDCESMCRFFFFGTILPESALFR